MSIVKYDVRNIHKSYLKEAFALLELVLAMQL